MPTKFSTRRGRPKLEREVQDCGTPELRMKHALGITQEAIDVCLQRGVIKEAEHRAALHFRWLYTLRFGCPTVHAMEYAKTFISDGSSEHDEAWKQAREEEYREALAVLEDRSIQHTVMQVVVFGMKQGRKNALYLKQGLDALARHWGYKKSGASFS